MRSLEALKKDFCNRLPSRNLAEVGRDDCAMRRTAPRSKKENPETRIKGDARDARAQGEREAISETGFQRASSVCPRSRLFDPRSLWITNSIRDHRRSRLISAMREVWRRGSYHSARHPAPCAPPTRGTLFLGGGSSGIDGWVLQRRVRGFDGNEDVTITAITSWSSPRRMMNLVRYKLRTPRMMTSNNLGPGRHLLGGFYEHRTPNYTRI